LEGHGYPTSIHQLAILASVALMLLASGCSSTAKSQFDNLNTVSLSALTPPSMTLAAGAQQQFSITASGASNTEIIWSLIDSSGNLHYSCSTSNCSDVNDTTLGTISAAGLYIAPSASSSQLVYVNAAAAADTSVSRQAAVTVGAQPPPISVTISPTSACVQTGQSADFTAVVSNGSGVTWEVNGTPGGTGTTGNGTITSAGVYTAPGSPMSVTVTAVSVQDSTKSASATVQVQTSCQNVVTVSASSATVYPGQSIYFTASVSGNPPDPAVSWGLNCSNCGQVTYTGQDSMTYTAPSTVNSSFKVTVTATMTSPPGSAGQAIITVVPLNPQLQMVFNPPGPLSVSGSQQATVTAYLTGVPDGTAFTVTWPVGFNGGPYNFCVSTDNELSDYCGSADTGDVDDNDGPGTLNGQDANPVTKNGTTPNGVSVTYQVPGFVKIGASGQSNFTNATIASQCAAITGATVDDAHPYVLITAQTTYNATNLSVQNCIPLTQ